MSPESPAPPPPGASSGRPLAWGLGLVALAVVLLRWRLLDVPLERDEGEYAYGGRMLARGVLPYVGFYNMKLPGIYAAYAAVLAVFGESVRGIHLGLALANAASAVFLGLWVRRLAGVSAGLVAAAAFGLLALLPSVQGTSANAEHFVLAPALAGLWWTSRCLSRRRLLPLLAGGALVGSAVLVKQHGAVFGAVGLALVALPPGGAPLRTRLRAAGLFAAGLVAPYLAVVAAYAAAGHLDDFWLWTVRYARLYAAEPPPDGALERLGSALGPLLVDAPLAWGAAAGGALALGVGRYGARARWVLGALLAAGLAGVAPGLYFRPHYFVLLLPAVAALAAAGASVSCRPALRVAAAVALLAATLLGNARFLFGTAPEDVTRLLYGTNPFVESESVAAYLQQHTAPDETVAVLGSEPQLLFLADRSGASGFLYTYPLMEGHELARGMQDRWIAEVEAARPAFLVYVHHPHSLRQTEESPTRVFHWFADQVAEYPRVARYLLDGAASRWALPHELAEPPGPGFFSIDLHRRRDS